jgi:flagellar protein FlaG
VNTETVRPLSVTATKPAASDPTTQQRQTASPVSVPQASIPKPPTQNVVDTRSVEETTAAVAAQLESYLRSIGRSVQFSIDSASGRTVVSVRDAATGDVIRQMPSEEALRLAQALGSGGSSLVDVIV